MSVATAWEIAIKVRINKLKLSAPPDKFFYDYCNEYDFEILPIFAHHALETYNLPLLHHDPFDRVSVAQAQTENLILITGDPLIQRYEVTTLW